jgi:hypothetical protein
MSHPPCETPRMNDDVSPKTRSGGWQTAAIITAPSHRQEHLSLPSPSLNSSISGISWSRTVRFFPKQTRSRPSPNQKSLKIAQFPTRTHRNTAKFLFAIGGTGLRPVPPKNRQKSPVSKFIQVHPGSQIIAAEEHFLLNQCAHCRFPNLFKNAQKTQKSKCIRSYPRLKIQPRHATPHARQTPLPAPS